MLNIDLYIHSTGSISPAANINEPVKKLLANEPDYTGFIPPNQLRRMSKVIRMGIGAAKTCMETAGIERPDALSIGTAMGCLHDTELFLSKMVSQEEKMLTPTAFIQSTHNTVGGQIALLAGCYGHNMTYVHRGHSFEHAIINTKLYLQDHPGETVLAGGIDELTESSHLLMQRAGFYSDQSIIPVDLLTQEGKGTLAGEGATFFTVNKQNEGAKLKISKLYLFKAASPDEAFEQLSPLLNDLQAIDFVVMGKSGDANNSGFYDQVQQVHFSDIPVGNFKQFCGEYATAGAYGLSLLVNGMAGQSFPQGFFVDEQPQTTNRALLINHYCDHYSCWVVEAL